MLITLCLIIVSFIFAIIDLIPLYQKEEWVSFFLYSAILVVALVTAILLDLKIVIPSPAEPIKKIVTFIFGVE